MALLAFLLATSLGAQTREAIAGILGRRVDDFGVQGQEARTVLEGIGAAYRFPVIVDADVRGTITFEVHNATVGTVIEAICQAGGLSDEVSADGYLLVRRLITRIYPVDYLQMTRTGIGSTAAGTGRCEGGWGGSPGSPDGSVGESPTPGISERNDSDFWSGLEADLRGMLGEGESLAVNRFAGLVQLRGTLKTHAVVAGYLRRVLQRVGRQARISVKVLEVDLNERSKAGIDWSAAGVSAGRVSDAAPGATTAQAGSTALNPSLFAGTIGAGGVQAAINALAGQGTVRVQSRPEIAALNNQTAFVQVSEELPFFSRAGSTVANASGADHAGSRPFDGASYSESTISLGNVLEITVQISDDLTTKLWLSPEMTEFRGTATSPDGRETVPITGTRRARTTVTVRNHETAVIGGFTAMVAANDMRRIPVLSRVPVIGGAFTAPERVRTRTELVFLVTVDAEEPSAPSPIDADGQDPMPPAPALPAGGRRSVERIDITGT